MQWIPNPKKSKIISEQKKGDFAGDISKSAAKKPFIFIYLSPLI